MLFRLLIDPVFILCVLIITSVFCKYTHRKQWEGFAAGAAFWLFVIWISPVPKWLIGSLESSYPPFDSKVSNVDNSDIMILGSGYTLDTRLPATGQLSGTALGRLVEGVRIYKLYHSLRFITSGHPNTPKKSQAEVAALAALELGVSPKDTLLLGKTLNTADEAVWYKRRFGTDRNLILVTDALHMPRAMMWFQSHGINVKAAPANFMVKINPDKKTFAFKPSLKKIIMMKKAMKEYAGILYFKLFA